MAGLSNSHAEWLEKRGIDVEIAARYGVTSKGPWLLFPYTDGGKVVYTKQRNVLRKDFRCEPAGIPQTRLFNEDCLLEPNEDRSPLIITEGEIDALSVLQAGFQFVVSVPSGAANTAAGCASKVRRCLAENGSDESAETYRLKPTIATFAKVVLLTDCDHDGLLLREAMAAFIGPEYCWVPEYPEGCKDANDVLLKHGIEGVRALVERARPLRSDGFLPLTEIAQPELPRTMSTGFTFLDPHIKVTRPEFIVIAGMSGAGKSTVTQAITFGLCWTNKLKASIFNGEGHEAVVLQRARRFWRAMNPNANTDDEAVQAVRDRWIRNHLALIKPPQDELPTFEWLLWAMEQQALNRDRQVFVIDPWNEIIHERGRSVSVTEYTGEAIIKMKRLAARHGLILIVSHHIRKPDQKNDVPSMYDIADSAHWYNKADHGIIVHRPDPAENKTLLHIAKSKDHEFMGRPGKVWVAMQKSPFTLRQVAGPDGSAPSPESSDTPPEDYGQHLSDPPFGLPN